MRSLALVTLFLGENIGLERFFLIVFIFTPGITLTVDYLSGDSQPSDLALHFVSPFSIGTPYWHFRFLEKGTLVPASLVGDSPCFQT